MKVIVELSIEEAREAAKACADQSTHSASRSKRPAPGATLQAQAEYVTWHQRWELQQSAAWRILAALAQPVEGTVLAFKADTGDAITVLDTGGAS